MNSSVEKKNFSEDDLTLPTKSFSTIGTGVIFSELTFDLDISSFCKKCNSSQSIENCFHQPNQNKYFPLLASFQSDKVDDNSMDEHEQMNSSISLQTLFDQTLVREEVDGKPCCNKKCSCRNICTTIKFTSTPSVLFFKVPQPLDKEVHVNKHLNVPCESSEWSINGLTKYSLSSVV